MKFVYNNFEKELELPAFFVGNGINMCGKTKLEWKKLLSLLFPEDKKDIVEEDLKSLTYPEIASLANVYRKKQNKKMDLLHKTVCEEINKFEENFLKEKDSLKNHKTVMEFAKKYNFPVLTTNYDHLLLKAINYQTKSKSKNESIETPYWLVEEGSKKSLHYWTPLNAYFTDGKSFEYNKTDLKKKFALWFVHGMKRYQRSICIDDNDYIRNITTIKKYLDEDYYEDYKNWLGRNTWLDIFLNNDLIILGFGFSFYELDLRWLLFKRYSYQLYLVNSGKIKEQRKIIYIKRKNDKLKDGDDKLFKVLGIDVVEMTDVEIYKLGYLK